MTKIQKTKYSDNLKSYYIFTVGLCIGIIGSTLIMMSLIMIQDKQYQGCMNDNVSYHGHCIDTSPQKPYKTPPDTLPREPGIPYHLVPFFV